MYIWSGKLRNRLAINIKYLFKFYFTKPEFESFIIKELNN